MPEKRTMERARKDARDGKSPSTQAGEFVREEIRHIRQGKHGAKSTRQAIAIGLGKARRAGVKLGPQPKPKRKSAAQRRPASTKNLSRQATQTSSRRSPAARSRSAKKAARTRARR
jgi:hypothetical protein